MPKTSSISGNGLTPPEAPAKSTQVSDDPMPQAATIDNVSCEAVPIRDRHEGSTSQQTSIPTSKLDEEYMQDIIEEFDQALGEANPANRKQGAAESTTFHSPKHAEVPSTIDRDVDQQIGGIQQQRQEVNHPVLVENQKANLQEKPAARSCMNPYAYDILSSKPSKEHKESKESKEYNEGGDLSHCPSHIRNSHVQTHVQSSTVHVNHNSTAFSVIQQKRQLAHIQTFKQMVAKDVSLQHMEFGDTDFQKAAKLLDDRNAMACFYTTALWILSKANWQEQVNFDNHIGHQAMVAVAKGWTTAVGFQEDDFSHYHLALAMSTLPTDIHKDLKLTYETIVALIPPPFHEQGKL